MINKIKVVFLVYLICLIFFVLFKFNFTIDDMRESIEHFRLIDYNRVNLKFLNSIKMQLNIMDRWAILNLFGNTIPFLIYGFLFSVTFKITLFKSFIINSSFILSLELIQLIFVIGTFDIDDIFLNLLSILLGFLFGKYVFKNHLYNSNV